MRLSKEAFVHNWVLYPCLDWMARDFGTTVMALKQRASALRRAGINVPQKSPGPRVLFRAGRRGPEARRLNRLIRRAERVLGRLA